MNSKTFVIAIVLLIALTATVSAQEPAPIPADGENDDRLCARLGQFDELLILAEQVHTGLTFMRPDGFAVKITDVMRANGRITRIDWQVSEISEPAFGGVDVTVWKGGDAFGEVRYDPEAMSGFHAEQIPGNCGLGLCYISFCYDTKPTAVSLNSFSAHPLSLWQSIINAIGGQP